MHVTKYAPLAFIERPKRFSESKERQIGAPNQCTGSHVKQTAEYPNVQLMKVVEGVAHYENKANSERDDWPFESSVLVTPQNQLCWGLLYNLHSSRLLQVSKLRFQELPFPKFSAFFLLLKAGNVVVDQGEAGQGLD